MNPTQKVPKYKDPVLDATGKQIGVAVFDPNTGKALEGAEAFNPNTGTPITSEMMAPKAELKLPEKTVDTTASSLINEETLKAESSIDKEQAKLQTERDTQVTDISKLIQDIAGTEAKQTQYATDAGADTANEKIQNIDDEMLVQSRALKAKIEQIRSNPFITQNMASLLANDEERKSASYIADLSITKSILNRDYDRAIKTAERKVEAELAPMKAELEAKKFVFDNNKDYFNAVQKAKFDRIIKDEDRKYNEEKDKLETINKLVITAQQNGADQATIDKIKNAKDTTEASVAIGKYASDPLERKIKEAQLAKLNQDMSQDRVKFGERNAVVDGVVGDVATTVDTSDPVSFFSSVIKSNKIKGSASLESLLGVIEATKNLANEGIASGGFKGSAPIRFTPGFLKGEKQINTQGQINAINLKVQQWASGAALTEAQTKQVKKFTPDKNDTDKQIKAKLNNLTNFMISQGKSSLANQGVDIDFPKVDLFDTTQTAGTEEEYINTIEGALNNTSSLYGEYGL